MSEIHEYEDKWLHQRIEELEKKVSILCGALERIYSPYLTPDYSSSDLRELAGQAIIDVEDGKMTVDDALVFVGKSDTNLGIALDILAHEVIRLQKALHYIGYDCKAWGDFTFRDYAREALQKVGGEGGRDKK